MPPDIDVYLYGMTVWSTVHRLHGDYPEADTYGEIAETHQFPGGETGNAALLLARWGYATKIDGPCLGTQTQGPILSFYAPYGIDCSDLQFDPDQEGVQDLVLVGGSTRTVFGRFAAYFSMGRKWSVPRKESIRSARIVSVDPFFGDESLMVAEVARELGIPYVTIDCPADSFLHQNAAVTILSGEFLRDRGAREDLYRQYTECTKGLVIFTSGSRPIVFGRKGEVASQLPAYQVEVKSTLGAGDTFRAGVIHGLLKGYADEQIVRFAAATSACVCRRFPMAFDPPGLLEIQSLVQQE